MIQVEEEGVESADGQFTQEGVESADGHVTQAGVQQCRSCSSVLLLVGRSTGTPGQVRNC